MSNERRLFAEGVLDSANAAVAALAEQNGLVFTPLVMADVEEDDEPLQSFDFQNSRVGKAVLDLAAATGRDLQQVSVAAGSDVQSQDFPY